jgi:hypothetical protein
MTANINCPAGVLRSRLSLILMNATPVGVEVGEGGDEMLQAPTESVNLPNEHGVKTTAMGVGHEAVECRAALLRAGDSFIHILGSNLPATTGSVLA